MNFPVSFPKQHQNIQPGLEFEMNPLPVYDSAEYNKKGDTAKNCTANKQRKTAEKLYRWVQQPQELLKRQDLTDFP